MKCINNPLHRRVGTLSITTWKLLCKDMQVSGKLMVVLAGILQPIRFNLTDTGQRDVEGEGDGRAEGDGEGAQVSSKPTKPSKIPQNKFNLY